MYYPILRGKQFELIAIRELAPKLKPTYFRPIIEPVRDKFSALSKTIKYLNDNSITPIVIINPSLGDFKDQDSNLDITKGLNDSIEEAINYLPCISTKNISLNEIQDLIKVGRYSILIEEGLNKELLPILNNAELVISNKYHREAFKAVKEVVIIGDNFKKAVRNSDYPDKSFYSEMHTDFKRKNITGFGDYTITGSEYTETGGPAYVVTVHLSYIEPDEFYAMYIKHFKSYDDNSPTQPGKKFGDALNSLIKFHKKNPLLLEDTIGLKGFIDLHTRDHFPGLGQVKKLSMQHHIETTCLYLEKEDA